MSEAVRIVIERISDARKTPNGYEAKCPAHDDKVASLSISAGNDGRALLHCHAGCAPIDICKSLGLRLAQLFPPKKEKIVATYDYRDAEDILLFQVVRFEGKQFRQRKPNGSGGWEWHLGDTPRVLYRLSDIINASPDEWIYVVEGEKDADRMASIGLVATCNPGGAGKWSKLTDDSALNGRCVAIIPDRDSPGIMHGADVAKRLTGRAERIRFINLPVGCKDVSDFFDNGGTAKELETMSGDPPKPVVIDKAAASRPNVLIDTEEHRAILETVSALSKDLGLYQRGGVLVRVVKDGLSIDSITRGAGSPIIQYLPTPSLRERITKVATFTKYNSKGEEIAAHPPAWLISGIDSRAEWDEIRPIFGVSDSPIIRPDGSIWQTPGYDAKTGVLYSPSEEFPTVHPDCNIDDASEAMSKLLDVVIDFPFEAEEHKSAWLAGLLTPLARFAFTGPSPLFLIDANVRGAGKGLLAQTIGRIVLGREMPVSSYAHDSEEMRKKITSIAIAGDRMILLDNLDGEFGNDALDRVLTSTRWKDRILGKSQEVELPMLTAWYATGNNVQVGADTLRRVIHIRMDCMSERPEDRDGFAHPDLLSWVSSHRAKLLAAALTVLAAYLRRGHRPRLRPFGSYEGWSGLVRAAVVWCGLPDPCVTRERLAEAADASGDALAGLVAAWSAYDRSGSGLVVADMLRELYPPHGQPSDSATVEMRSAVESLVGAPGNKAPTARQVGNRLRRIRRRVVDGRYLDTDDSKTRRGAVWKLHLVSER